MCHIKLVALLYDIQVAHSNPYQPLLSLLKKESVIQRLTIFHLKQHNMVTRVKKKQRINR